MDRQDVISMALEVVLETQREEKRRMNESLRADHVALVEKVSERSMLMRKKQGMLAKEVAKEKLVDDFMVFVEAIENDDLEIAQNFDEKAMMNTILTMMKSDGGDNGGLGCDYGDDVLKIGMDLEEKATMDTIVATVNSDGRCGGENGGIGGDYGDDVPKIKLGLQEKATIDTIVAVVNSDGSCGGDNGGFTGDYGAGGINNAPDHAHSLGEEAMIAAIEGTNSDGKEGRNVGGYGGGCEGNRRK